MNTNPALNRPDRILPNYGNICIDGKVIDMMEKTTILGLKRYKAFSHGVLKNNKTTGALLYGPPGTGKSLLATAVTKQCGFKTISVSPSDIFHKYGGELEREIGGIFSMARKLHPCIVFLDEADAILGKRKDDEQRFVRSMINTFLMKRDGLGSRMKSPFMLLATNRPDDLDPE